MSVVQYALISIVGLGISHFLSEQLQQKKH